MPQFQEHPGDRRRHLRASACARWRLRQQGWPVQLIRGAARILAASSTPSRRSGFRFDIGPQSFLATEALTALIDELGLDGESLARRTGARRATFCCAAAWCEGAPSGPGALLRTPLIGRRTKLRLLVEPLGRTHPRRKAMNRSRPSCAGSSARTFSSTWPDHSSQASMPATRKS